MIKASDLLIARRADTKARADFSTWRMMAKLNVASSLSTEAQARWYTSSSDTAPSDMQSGVAIPIVASLQILYR